MQTSSGVLVKAMPPTKGYEKGLTTYFFPSSYTTRQSPICRTQSQEKSHHFFFIFFFIFRKNFSVWFESPFLRSNTKSLNECVHCLWISTPHSLSNILKKMKTTDTRKEKEKTVFLNHGLGLGHLQIVSPMLISRHFLKQRILSFLPDFCIRKDVTLFC